MADGSRAGGHAVRSAFVLRVVLASIVSAAFGVTACSAPPTIGPPDDGRFVTIDVASPLVDPHDAVQPGTEPRPPRVLVRLPRGYADATDRSYPVLYLLGGIADDYETWALPQRGDISEVADDLDAVVVMPDAGNQGFYTDWYRSGAGCCPAWERWLLDEVRPLVERRFRVATDRDSRTIAGISMGGYGAMAMAARHPDLFGTVVSISGYLNTQRGDVVDLYEAARAIGIEPVHFRDMWGDLRGAYASERNPTALVDALRGTRVFVSVGSGHPDPYHDYLAGYLETGYLPPPIDPLELIMRATTDDFVAAASVGGVTVTYRPHEGTHAWQHWREDLRAAIAWGLYKVDA